MQFAATEQSLIHAGKAGSASNPLGFDSFFTKDQFAKIRALMHPKHAEAGTLLFWEGEPIGKMYYICSGKVKLRKSTEEGRDFILSIMQAGDMVYEPEDGIGTVHSFTAEVMEDAELGIIPWKDFEALLVQNGELAVRFIHWMALMQKVTASKFRDLLLYGKTGALASTLVRLANSYGIQAEDGLKINLKLTNSELADFIGTTRESVNRMLSTLREKGIVDIRKGYIHILNLDDLKSECECPAFPGCSREVCRI